jgi:hypothetical protein
MGELMFLPEPITFWFSRRATFIRMVSGVALISLLQRLMQLTTERFFVLHKNSQLTPSDNAHKNSEEKNLCRRALRVQQPGTGLDRAGSPFIAARAASHYAELGGLRDFHMSLVR